MDKGARSGRDRAWLAGLVALLLVWVFLLGFVAAGLWLPGHPFGGPVRYLVPAGYHLAPDVWPSPALR